MDSVVGISLLFFVPLRAYFVVFVCIFCYAPQKSNTKGREACTKGHEVCFYVFCAIPYLIVFTSENVARIPRAARS